MTAAKADGVTIRITSGRRSAAKQQRLLNEAIEKYGSYKAATRWVLPPEVLRSRQGKAVDIGPAAAMQWLNKNGCRYGDLPPLRQRALALRGAHHSRQEVPTARTARGRRRPTDPTHTNRSQP